MERQKRVAAIHDISGFGRCSLTVALPIISAAGIETSVIPTAILSTHTGGFTGFTYRDLTGDLMDIAKHWKSLGLEFDALYSGFLGSFEQLDIVSEIFNLLKTDNTHILVDPVMADNGEMYKIFSSDFAKGMKKLCGKADTIVPNITEAVFMLGEEYKEGPYDESYISHLLHRLGDLGPSRVVLTGVHFDDANIGAASYDKDLNKIEFALSSKIEGYYHGTGDVFGSALLSALINGFDLHRASEIAVDFTTSSIARTFKAKTDLRYGVNFEQSLPEFVKIMQNMD